MRWPLIRPHLHDWPYIGSARTPGYIPRLLVSRPSNSRSQGILVDGLSYLVYHPQLRCHVASAGRRIVNMRVIFLLAIYQKRASHVPATYRSTPLGASSYVRASILICGVYPNLFCSNGAAKVPWLFGMALSRYTDSRRPIVPCGMRV
jgi:hypothetical protein